MSFFVKTKDVVSADTFKKASLDRRVFSSSKKDGKKDFEKRGKNNERKRGGVKEEKQMDKTELLRKKLEKKLGKRSEKREEEEEEEEKRRKAVEEIQRKLADVPFEVREKMKQNASSDGQEEKLDAKKMERAISELKKKKRQRDSDAPVEISAKIPVKRFKQVRGLGPTKAKPRDPRFRENDKSVTEFFENKYSFLVEMQEKDLANLRKQLDACKDAEEKEKLRKAINILSQKIDLRKRNVEERNLKKELLEEQVERVRQGKNPFYLKKSHVRQIKLKKKFQDLSKNEKTVESYIKKKRVSNMIRQKKKLPTK